MRAAARMVGVNASSLSRREDLEVELAGRSKRLRPQTVLALAEHYRLRPLNSVAYELVEYARKHAPASAEAIEAEVDAYLEGRPTPVIDAERWLRDAERLLPAELLERVRAEISPDVAAVPQVTSATSQPERLAYASPRARA